MIKEFRDFINQGNIIDLAVAFVMGVAFTAVVNTLVERIINPAIGLVFDVGNLDAIGTFGDGGSFGAFIGAIINFVLVGLALFFVIKAYNRMKASEDTEEEAPEEPSEQVALLTEIRDALTSGQAR